MTPSLKQRLGLAPSPQLARHRNADTGLMARSLMLLFLAGATISLFGLLAAEPMQADETRLLATTASAYAISAVLLIGYDRLPRVAFPALLACGTMLIEWTIYGSGESTSAYAMFYFWIAIYAFYFFSRVQAVLQLGFIAASYAAVLAVIPDAHSPSVLRWAITTSALVVAGALIGLLKDRVERLIGELRDATRSDALTGLLNRRAFVDALEMELERARRGHAEVGLIVINLNRLQAVAAQLGEDEADRTLERIGSVLAGAIRRIDTAARIGDRSFGVIVPYTGDHGTYVLAERFQGQVLDELADLPVTLNVSVGVASFPSHAATAEQLRHVADQAVGAARQLGRDRVVSYAVDAVARSATASQPT